MKLLGTMEANLLRSLHLSSLQQAATRKHCYSVANLDNPWGFQTQRMYYLA